MRACVRGYVRACVCARACVPLWLLTREPETNKPTFTTLFLHPSPYPSSLSSSVSRPHPLSQPLCSAPFPALPPFLPPSLSLTPSLSLPLCPSDFSCCLPPSMIHLLSLPPSFLNASLSLSHSTFLILSLLSSRSQCLPLTLSLYLPGSSPTPYLPLSHSLSLSLWPLSHLALSLTSPCSLRSMRGSPTTCRAPAAVCAGVGRALRGDELSGTRGAGGCGARAERTVATTLTRRRPTRKKIWPT